MKKLLSLALVLAMVLVFAVPVMATAPSGFITGDVTQIDKKGYDNFAGTEITSNNSITQFDGFNFVADNKTFNAWYIDVLDDISGTLEVAYKSSSNYFTVVFEINGAGKYWIGDSKGSNGTNMVKIGAIHLHVYVAVVTPPTCLDEGYTVFTCECGKSYIGDYIPALGHDWDDGVITTPAACEDDGVMTFTCKRDGCGATYTEVIPAHGHDYERGKYNYWPATCEEDAHWLNWCFYCGEDGAISGVDEGTALGHDYVAVVTEPTCTEDGFTTYTCSRCGKSYVGDYIDALGHNYIDCGIQDVGDEHGVLYECSRCGDSYVRKTVIKYDIVSIYSNADGVNYQDPASVYVQLETGDTYDWHKIVFGSWDPPHPIIAGVPTEYSPEDFFTNNVIPQYIWDKPYDETELNDVAVFEFSYSLKSDVLRRELVALMRPTLESTPVSGPWFYIFNDCSYAMYINGNIVHTSVFGDEPDHGNSWYAHFEGADWLSIIIGDTSVDTFNIRIEAINENTDPDFFTNNAAILFCGAFAYEYEVFAD